MYVSPIMSFNNSAHNAQIKRTKSKGITTENKFDNNRIENYYATAPSFKMSEYKVAAKAAAAAFTAALASYGIKVAQNTEPEEEAKLPTYEKFEKMVESDINISKENREYLLEKFIENPEYAWDLYNLKDTNGYRYFWLDNAKHQTVHPEIAKILVNIQNDNGCKLFDLNKAADLSPGAAEYPIGFAAMLSVQDEYGQKRFEPYDFSYAKDFETNLQKAIKMATAKNELGNYKYESIEIADRQEITDDDKILENIADIKRPDGKRARLGPDNIEVINAYKKYPEEVTKLLRLSTKDDNTKNRFDLYFIDEKVVRFFKEAPTTFMTLANSLYRSRDGITIKAIEKIMETLCHNKQNDTIHEIDGKTLSDVIMLDRVMYNVPGCITTEKLIEEEGAEKYIKILEAYRKYPAEFIYIAKNYNTRYSYVKAPTVDDILLFKNDREKFEHTL